MKLYIAENLRKCRREADLTQEQLANELGVSTQAVSKWECGDGYPDITMLPVIARYFDISVDTLLGNDRNTILEDKRRLSEEIEGLGHKETADRMIEFLQKYPNDMEQTSVTVCDLIYNVSCIYPPKEREQYVPAILRYCKKVIENCKEEWIREVAISGAVTFCQESELEEWIRCAPLDYKSVSGELREERYWTGIEQNRENQGNCFLRTILGSSIICFGEMPGYGRVK